RGRPGRGRPGAPRTRAAWVLAHELPALGPSDRAARAPLGPRQLAREPRGSSLTSFPLSVLRTGPLGPRSDRGNSHASRVGPRSRASRSRSFGPGRSGPARTEATRTRAAWVLA